MTAIAVREHVNEDKPVMKSHGDFVGWIGSEFDPGSAVVEQSAQLHRYQPVVNPDIPLTGPELACPPPHVAQHLPMQVLDESFAQQIAPPAERPPLRTGDILLLGLVQFGAVGNVSWDEIAHFLRRERRRMVRLLENLVHGTSHNRLGLVSRRNSSSCASESCALTAW